MLDPVQVTAKRSDLDGFSSPSAPNIVAVHHEGVSKLRVDLASTPAAAWSILIYSLTPLF